MLAELSFQLKQTQLLRACYWGYELAFNTVIPVNIDQMSTLLSLDVKLPAMQGQILLPLSHSQRFLSKICSI